MKLTKTRVERIQPEPGRDLLRWDDALPSFGVRVKPSGVRSYIVQYRNRAGRSRRITIGRHGLFTLEQARKAARRVLLAAADGQDPAEERAEKRPTLTIADLGERYLDEHARPKKKPSSVKADLCNLKNHILPTLSRREIADVSRTDVARLHHSMRGIPGGANRTLALLSKMFNLAELWGLRPDGTNPCRHVERYRERKIQRFLSDEELARLGNALERAECDDLASCSAIAAIRLLIFTGCRSSEILGLRWEHIDQQRNLLRLPDSKTGARIVPLNAPALAVLSQLERNGFPWVLPGRRPRSHLVNLSKPWDSIRKLARLHGLRLHDLRHSFASVGASSGLGLPIIGKLLGHTQAATTQRYAHLADGPLRKASEAIAAHLENAMNGLSIVVNS